MTGAPITDPNPLALAAAGFLAQALELRDNPAAIMNDLTEMKADPNAAIYSIEVDSSIGVAAFLVYVYVMQERNEDGLTGDELYRQGLATLQQATDRDTPGPRMVAHAETETVAFILATTPATWRAMQGESPPSMVATEGDLLMAARTEEERAAIAEDLHRSLKEANDHARTWLAAISAAGSSSDADVLTFTEAETALALFVLDSANVEPTLNALNLLVTGAQEQAGKMISRRQAAAPDRAGEE
ncbi:MAG TPA: hypothetical protein VGR22_07620 [Thermomicrobiales bacterium]|nr:hypothetical protein [Thermomicrobiales bacterium]